jgi:serine/threonine kinase PknH
MYDTARISREGSQFGRYYLKRRIGHGGLGEVYEAEDTVEQRMVALKLVPLAFSHDLVFCARLQRAARTAARLREPHIVPIHDSGEIDGQPFLDMRLIEGTDLSGRLKQSGALTPPQAVATAGQVALALDAAHAVGLVHGDIKPENILITPSGFVYLVDFGIAAAAARDGLAQIVGSAVGTWKYTAPERFTDPVVSHKVDIYALACVLYECVTGSPPYQADSIGALTSAHLTEPVPQPSQVRPELSGAFDDVIARGMAKDPQERYATAGDLALAAHAALSPQDQDRVVEIIQRSQDAPLPDADSEMPPSGAAPAAPAQSPASTAPPESAAPPPPPVAAAEPASTPASQAGTPDSEPKASAPPPPTAEAVSPAASTGAPQVVPRFGLGGGGWPDEPIMSPSVPHPSWAPPRRRPPWLLLGAGAVLTVLILAVGAIWLLHPLHSRPAVRGPITTTTSASTAPRPPIVETQARLFSLLPAGYPPGTCKPIPPTNDALAAASCDKNSDPDGPPSATYTLFPDAAALRAAFDRIIQASNVIECPGHIQSPGPWHRSVSPDKASGILMCGIQQGSPIVAWTNESELLVNVAKTESHGPTVEQLYTWWTSHS